MKSKKILISVLAGFLSVDLAIAQSCTNCGVGTNNPQSKFEVRGCTNDSTTSGFRVTNSDSSSGVLLFVRDDKRVGINTIHPITTFDIRSTANGGMSLVNTNSNPQIGFYVNSSSTSNFQLGVDYSDANKLKIGTSSFSTTRMTIDASGNVGIGTTSPGQMFSVGASNQFQVNSSGDIVKLKNLTYSWPSAHTANGVLTNDGSGNLTWTAPNGTYWLLTGNSGTTAGTNYLGTSDNVDLVFKTNGSERYRVLSSGNVGIHTSGPDRILDVLDASNPQLRLTYTDGSVYTDFQTTSSGYLYLNPSGTNVGFGTSTPSAIIGLVPNSSGQTIQIERESNASNNGSPFTILGGGAKSGSTNKNGGDLTLSSGLSTGSGSSKILFQTTTAGSSGTSDVSPTTKMVILGSGNVGIGTTSPSTILAFDGTAGRTIQMERHTTSNTAGNDFTLISGGATSGATNKNGGGLILQSGTSTGTGTSTISFLTSTAGSSGTSDNTPTTKMTILGSGNVGIGTTSPSSILSFDGTSGRTIQMERHTTSNTAGNNFTLLSGGATSGATNKNGGDLILSSGTSTGTGTSTITFQTSTAGSSGTSDNSPTTKMTILGSGNVGIGITNPTELVYASLNQNARTSYTVSNTTDGTGGCASFIMLGYNGGGGSLSLTSHSYSTVSGWNDALFLDAGTPASGGLILSAPGSGAPMTFYTGGRTSSNVRMTITSGGKVGIGNITPSVHMDVDGGLSIRSSGSTVSISGAGSVISVSDRSYIRITSTGANTMTNPLTQGLVQGQVLVIEFAGSTNSATFTDDAALSGGGNIRLNGNFTMNQYDSLTLIWNGTDWVETARSSN